jgi:hypothetical protein
VFSELAIFEADDIGDDPGYLPSMCGETTVRDEPRRTLPAGGSRRALLPECAARLAVGTGAAAAARHGSRASVTLTGRFTRKLGRADDEGSAADGVNILSYDQALKRAREAQAHLDAKRTSGVLPGAGKLTVNYILDEDEKGYPSGEARQGERPGRDTQNVRSIFNRHVRPALGDIQLDRLTANLLKKFKIDWQTGRS